MRDIMQHGSTQAIDSKHPRIIIALILTCFCTIASAQNWQLSCSDEFDYQGMPDSSKWREISVLADGGVGWDCAGRLKNTNVDSGMLHVTVYREDTTIHSGRGSTTYHYTSGEVCTKGQFVYCKFDVCASLPA